MWFVRSPIRVFQSCALPSRYSVKKRDSLGEQGNQHKTFLDKYDTRNKTSKTVLEIHQAFLSLLRIKRIRRKITLNKNIKDRIALCVPRLATLLLSADSFAALLSSSPLTFPHHSAAAAAKNNFHRKSCCHSITHRAGERNISLFFRAELHQYVPRLFL